MQKYCRKVGYLYALNSERRNCLAVVKLICTRQEIRLVLTRNQDCLSEGMMDLSILYKDENGKPEKYDFGKLRLCFGVKEYLLKATPRDWNPLEVTFVGICGELGEREKVGSCFDGAYPDAEFYQCAWGQQVEEKEQLPPLEKHLQRLELKNEEETRKLLPNSYLPMEICAAQLFLNRPAVNPFRTVQFDQCAKISLSDLHLLGETKSLGENNSFVCHSYYRYRHLLLAKEPGQLWLLAPGIYCIQERRIAELYGFPQFRFIRSQNKRNGFGYWMHRLCTITPDHES